MAAGLLVIPSTSGLKETSGPVQCVRHLLGKHDTFTQYLNIGLYYQPIVVSLKKDQVLPLQLRFAFAHLRHSIVDKNIMNQNQH